MVTVSQIQKGFVHFIDNDVSVVLDGWQKAVVAGCAGLIAANFPNMVKVYASHPFVSALGIYDAQSGMVDIDALYNAVVPHIGADKIPVTLPKIGTIKIGQPELNSLMRYIKEA